MKERKLKDEIIRFANSPVGTKIWVKEMGSWNLVDYARWFEDEDDIVYIVDDEFANLRKLEIDGKILQFKYHDIIEKVDWNFVKIEELKFYTIKRERTFIDIYESDLQGEDTFNEFLDCKNAVHMEKDEIQFVRFYTESEDKTLTSLDEVDIPITTHDINLFKESIIDTNRIVKWTFSTNDFNSERKVNITFMSQDEYEQRRV